VEHLANQRIRANFALEESRDTPIAKAQQMGAMALFGEKYGDKVRVIKFGNSIELCGGTHVHSTGEIGMVRIVSESSIAAGIRRIEAITGEAVEKLLDEAEDFINYTKEFLHNAPDLQAALRKVIEENADLKKDIEGFVQNKIAELAESLLSQANAERHSCEDGNLLNNITVIQHATELPAEHVKMLAFQLRSRQPENLFAVIGSIFDGKPSLTVLLSDDLVAKGMNAVQIIREAAKEIQGGGGGQPFFAQAGGKNADGVEKAIEKAAAFAIKN
jgi:alanyl-tRNA synthetase